MDRIVRYSTAPYPEDHKPEHCDCSCFGKGFTVRIDDETNRPTAFGRVVSKDEDFVYVDWYETYDEGQSQKIGMPIDGLYPYLLRYSCLIRSDNGFT